MFIQNGAKNFQFDDNICCKDVNYLALDIFYKQITSNFFKNNVRLL